MAEVLTGHVLMDALIAAGIVDGHFLQRVILDVPCDGAVTIYVQRIGDERLLNIDFVAHLAIEEKET